MTRLTTAEVRALLDAVASAHDEAARGDAWTALYGKAPALCDEVLALAEERDMIAVDHARLHDERDAAVRRADALAVAVRREREARFARDEADVESEEAGHDDVGLIDAANAATEAWLEASAGVTAALDALLAGGGL